ncbi:MAG TPA: bifunctional salicylyl-CoA 5-hydroxylase/oxidoreductase [Burkholderiales bacterium]|nr:bifunctional salicylyl-CoA 5-hydroxylase/oxidoreductase [Burkholderiales bacterium]
MKVSIIGGGAGGLYFALLAKKAWPDWDITVFERNRPDDTFGFGVVFSDQTLDTFKAYDVPSYEMIRRRFAYWGDVDVVYKGRVMRSGGNGFCGCSRVVLLQLLHERCRELGVKLGFQREVEDLSEFADSDLIVVADGINSKIRDKHKEHFQPSVDLRPNKFTWLGSTRPLDAFKYFFRETPEGIILAHCYQYEKGRSTWVIETDEATWKNFGFDRKNEAEMLATLEGVFAEELAGHKLIANRSIWRNFPTIVNRTWVMRNAVLIGDAKATAHFSIGSGTKLAMEDAIALFEALRKSGGRRERLAEALTLYDTARREEVEKTQHAANVSLAWFEHMKRYWGMDPLQFAFGVMSRSKQITWENLELRDPGFVRDVQRWFALTVRGQGFEVDLDNPPVPMFTPFRLRGMQLENRVVVSPMDQYSAVDGMPTDWHLVHLGSRAIGGAGLVYVEMTCVSPEGRISPGCTGLWSEAQRDAFKRLVDFCHANSRAKLCMQIGHSGRKGSTQLGWERMDHPLERANWPLVAPSPIPYEEGISQVPREMTRQDMDEVLEQFVRATRYADEAGFDMLELHMAHGYLLASFVSPLTNTRTDEYGGPIENRMRYPLEVFRACRAAWPPEKPMSVRISATDWAPGGLSGEDLMALARMLKKAGCDLIDCSTGQTVPHQKPVYGRMYQAPFSDWVRNEVGIATMTVGAVTTPDQVNTLLAAGKADLVALARPHLTNPYFTLQASAWYQHLPQHWPIQYLSGRDQAFRLAARDRAELIDTKLRARPASHEVTVDEAIDDETARVRHAVRVVGGTA